MAISKRKRRVLAVLHLPRTTLAILAFADAVVKAMNSSRYFPHPTPPLELVLEAIDEVRRAQAHVDLRTLGAADERDEKLATLVGLMGAVRAHAQGVADTTYPARAEAVIRSAGLEVRKEQERKPVQFHAKLGNEPGTVKIVAPAAAKRASYDWEYSLDRGMTWTAMPQTLQSRMSLSGVPAQTIVELRYRATTKEGMSDWSGAIAIFVP
jgi:hypothetical protein